MINSSFTVGYRSSNSPITILGVTAIVPNLNGLLLFTEDGENFQIEADEMTRGKCSPYARLFVEYSNEKDIAEELADPEIKVYDHRAKKEV